MRSLGSPGLHRIERILATLASTLYDKPTARAVEAVCGRIGNPNADLPALRLRKLLARRRTNEPQCR